LASHIREAFSSYVHEIYIDSLTADRIPIGSIVVSTLEFTKPFLPTMTPARQKAMVTMTETASLLLCITRGGLFRSEDPESATILGFARTLMLERPSLKMPVLDLDTRQCSWVQMAKNVGAVLKQVFRETHPDLEFREHNGSLYISRFVPDIAQNIAFRQTQDQEKISTTIGGVGFAKLGLAALGQIGTLRFEQGMMPGIVKTGHVRVEVEAVGINAKDLYALTDKLDIKNATCGVEFSGTIVAAGSSGSSLAVGDRVVVMAPHHFSTYQDVPEWACYKLKENELPEIMSTMPWVFSTALYALEQRARLEAGQSILIHSGAGELGIAAIQVARMIGAEIFTTVGTEEKRQFLIENVGIAADHIFDSHSNSFAT
jgi:hypothetical protein